MGRLLATALFERIEADGTPDPGRRVFEVPCQFVERESA
jgi:DNA-binding LacI/PurR family transcriptional regulator